MLRSSWLAIKRWLAAPLRLRVVGEVRSLQDAMQAAIDHPNYAVRIGDVAAMWQGFEQRIEELQAEKCRLAAQVEIQRQQLVDAGMELAPVDGVTIPNFWRANVMEGVNG